MLRLIMIMRNYKKIFLLLVVLCTMVMLSSATVFAQQVEESTDMIDANEDMSNIVTIPIEVQNNFGIISIVCNLYYDNEVIVPVGSAAVSPFDNISLANLTYRENAVRIVWYNFAVKNIYEDGTVINIMFEKLNPDINVEDYINLEVEQMINYDNEEIDSYVDGTTIIFIENN